MEGTSTPGKAASAIVMRVTPVYRQAVVQKGETVDSLTGRDLLALLYREREHNKSKQSHTFCCLGILEGQ